MYLLLDNEILGGFILGCGLMYVVHVIYCKLDLRREFIEEIDEMLTTHRFNF